MPDVGFDRLDGKSSRLQHTAPFARPIFTHVRSIMQHVEAIQRRIDEIIFGCATVVDDEPAAGPQDTLHLAQCSVNLHKVMGSPAARDDVE